jgi:distribution and morphology protein 31
MAGNIQMRPCARCWRLFTSPFLIANGVLPELRLSHVDKPLSTSRTAFSKVTERSFSQSTLRIPRASAAERSLSKESLTSRPTVSIINPRIFSTSYTSGVGFSSPLGRSSTRPETAALFQAVWQRGIHSSARRRYRGVARRHKSSITNTTNAKNIPAEGQDAAQSGTSSPQGASSTPPKDRSSETKGYMHLPHMPKMPHRPTKEELLAAATGFWSRLKVRFKWFSIRSTRPWNVDDWSAFISWFFLGNLVWIFVGTTTFFSLLIYTVNTVVAQGNTKTTPIDINLLICLQKHLRDG